MIKATDIAYPIYQHPDLDLCEAFLTDFGMTLAAKTENALYMRGTGIAHHICVIEKAETPGFIGFAMQANASYELDRLVGVLGASELHDIDAPGGGRRVTLKDPDGFRIDVVYGIESVPELPMREPLPLNHAREKRRFGKTQRPVKEPAQILRLGHIAIDVLDFEKSFAWYTEVLGMIPTDSVYYGHPSYRIAAFLRCNRGSDYVDHHSIAISQGPKAQVHHAGFEVEDFDSVKIGHDWLLSKGYQPVWGIGRHLLGSQIFDYWQAPFGSFIEHFTDGDVFNELTETVNHAGSLDILYQWGGPVPQTFLN